MNQLLLNNLLQRTEKYNRKKNQFKMIIHNKFEKIKNS